MPQRVDLVTLRCDWLHDGSTSVSHKHICSCWSIELAAGWTAQSQNETWAGETRTFVAIVPESRDALFRLTPDERGYDAAEWVRVVEEMERMKGRPVRAIRCGDFGGNCVEHDALNKWIRGWALCAESIPLSAVYRCKLENRGRDDSAVDAMLNTLRLESSPA